MSGEHSTGAGPPAALSRRYLLAIVLGTAAAAAAGLLVLSFRFDIATPSMIDDWSFAGDPPRSFGELLTLFGEPVNGQRFRPSYELWSEWQWHTLGAPEQLTGPNLWGALRVALFVAGVILVPAVVAATSRPRPAPLELATLATVGGIVLFAGPWTSVDFFRLGPQEPVMLGAMSVGAALLLLATRRAIERGRTGGMPALSLAGLYLAGLALWGLGVYHKEASICVIVLMPFLYVWLDRRWSEEGVIDDPLWRSTPFRLTSVAALLPVGHVVLISATLSDEGASLYGADRPQGLGGWIDRAWDSISQQWGEMTPVVGTSAWRLTILAILVLLAGTSVWRRQVPWLPLGLVLTGWAVLAFQGVALIEQPRYYIPAMGLFVAAGILLLAQVPRWLCRLGILGGVMVGALNVAAVSDTLAGWRDTEQDEARGLQLVAELHPESCPVFMRNLDLERSEALPELLPLAGTELSGPCRDGFSAIIAGRREPVPGLPPGATRSMREVCLEETVLAETQLWEVVGCHRLRMTVNGEDVRSVLLQNRVVPGVVPSEVRERCADPEASTRARLRLRLRSSGAADVVRNLAC